MCAPVTSYPFSLSKKAATLESTPPDIATKTFLLRGVFVCLCLFQILAIFVSFTGPKVAPALKVPGMSVLSISRSFTTSSITSFIIIGNEEQNEIHFHFIRANELYDIISFFSRSVTIFGSLQYPYKLQFISILYIFWKDCRKRTKVLPYGDRVCSTNLPRYFLLSNPA